MILRKVTRYDFEDGSDVEFIPSGTRGVFDVWINGVKVVQMEAGVRPSEVRALYYHDVYGKDLDETLTEVAVEAPVEEEQVFLLASGLH